MRDIVLYLIICLFLFSCENSSKQIDNSDESQLLLHHIADSILFHAIFSEEVKIQDTLPVKDTMTCLKILTQEEREEMIAFCDLFVSAIQSNNIEKIKDVIDFPIWVECFSNWTYGDTIIVDNFFQYKELVFGDNFFSSMKKCETYFITIDNEEMFDIGTIIYEDDDNDSRIFRFKKCKNKYKLIYVFCAG